MSHIIKVTDLDAPEQGTFIMKSPKVIRLTLEAGCQPCRLLMERRQLAGQGGELLPLCGEIPVYVGDRDRPASLTDYALTRGILCLCVFETVLCFYFLIAHGILHAERLVIMMDRQIWAEITAKIAQIVGGKLDRIILYGSYARGTQSTESDIDIALILRGKLDQSVMDRLQDYLTDLDLEHGKLFSVVDIDATRFSAFQDVLPFYQNILKEGVVLWKAA